MPKINVYLPDDLANAVREAGVPVSAVCQRALADAVAAADTGPAVGASGAEPDLDRLRSRFTQKLTRVLELAGEAAGGQHPVTSVEITEALIEQGNNLALAVLRSLDIDPTDLRGELRATEATSRRSQSGARTAATLDELCERAAAAALALQNNYVGCEHLLLALLAGPATDPATATLHTLGLDRDKAQQAVRAALNGISYAQSNLSLSGLSAPIRSVLEEIRQRLGRLEQPHA
ncbi:MAG: Clp protease N-terminal domain-containing protein [Jatrophihabitans sp.]